MKRTSKGRIARRCAACLVLVAGAAWLLPTFVENRQNASAQQVDQEQYQSELHYHYSHNGQFPVGNIEQLFARR